MKDFWTMTRVCFSAIGGWLGYFMGGCDGLMAALILFVVADYTTGVMCAVVDKKLSSEVGFKGIFRKVMIFILVGMAHILDTQVIGAGSVLRSAVIFFYLFLFPAGMQQIRTETATAELLRLSASWAEIIPKETENPRTTQQDLRPLYSDSTALVSTGFTLISTGTAGSTVQRIFFRTGRSSERRLKVI